MFYVGLEVLVARTAVCIMDAVGQVVREQSVASTPETIAARSGLPEMRLSGSVLRPASTPHGSREVSPRPSCRSS